MQANSIHPSGKQETIEAKSERSRSRTIHLITEGISILSGLNAVMLVSLFARQMQWQFAVLAAFFAATACFGLAAVRVLYPKGKYNNSIGAFSMLFGLSILATAALINGVGLSAAVIYLIFTLIVSSATFNEIQANIGIITGVLTFSAANILGDFSPLPQVTSGLIDTVTPVVLGVLFLLYIIMLVRQFVTANMRIRLVTSFLAVVVIPLSILSFIQSQFMFSVLNNEVNQELHMAADQTARLLDSTLEGMRQTIVEASQSEAGARYLELPPNKRDGSAEEQELRQVLRVLDMKGRNSSSALLSAALLDLDGNHLFDVQIDHAQNPLSPVTQGAGKNGVEGLPGGTGINEGSEDYFLVPANTGEAFISPVQIVSASLGVITFSSPVENSQGERAGVLRARYDASILQDLLIQQVGLTGETSYPILVDENNIRLADTFTPEYIYRAVAPMTEEVYQAFKASRRLPDAPISTLSTNYKDFDQILKNYEGKPDFSTQLSANSEIESNPEAGMITSMETMPWKVIYIQADFSNAVMQRNQRKLSTLVTSLMAGIVGLMAVWAAHVLSRPIRQLTVTAQAISNGNLEATAPFDSADEYGTLGRAFNLMTGQLRTAISQLEERVVARTSEIENQNKALEQRARQLKTVSEVARQIVSSQELEDLLHSITQMISERFGFYHVGIFLLDENRQYAVLRSANSEGGQRMLARRHMLAVGRVGIVGHVTGTGEPRIATDVGKDAVFFNNPDLPNTRSEMALPLKIGDQIIGAIDIQSETSNAFSTDDIELFTTLADQVSIAIFNNQLYQETASALDEMQKLHRQYLRQEWTQDTTQRSMLGYSYNQAGTAPHEADNPLWQKVFNSGEPVYAVLPGEGVSGNQSVMAVPISVRGETIGVIHVQDEGNDRLWTADETAVVNSIAGQVAVALENARLFEHTVRRAEREKKVLEITQKIRSTNDPDEMMRIAVQELQRALRATRAQITISPTENGGTNGNRMDGER